MRDILKSAKKLSDKEIKKLIESLKSLLHNRNQKQLKDAIAHEAREREAQDVIRQIEEITAQKGISLERLGYKLVADAPAPAPARRAYRMKAEKQWYYIDPEGLPQLLFTRQLKQYKKDGLALTFGELSLEQQTLARALVESRNEKN